MITQKFAVKAIIIAAILLSSTIFARSEGCMGCHQGEVATSGEKSQVIKNKKKAVIPAKVD